jgi:hypothetical protein
MVKKTDIGGILSSEEYGEYLAKKTVFQNKRISPDGVSVFDFLLDKDSDFTGTPDGKNAMDIIMKMGSE